MDSDKEDMISDRLKDTEEMRLMLNVLSQKAKENIMKGIAMFEAGYHAGYLDGINSLKEKSSFPNE